MGAAAIGKKIKSLLYVVALAAAPAHGREGIMYICMECGHVFDNPHNAVIPHYELSGRIYEPVSECPACGSEDYENAQRCALCGTYISESQARFNLCPNCEATAERRFSDLLSKHFTLDELSYLNNQYDGRWFGT